MPRKKKTGIALIPREGNGRHKRLSRAEIERQRLKAIEAAEREAKTIVLRQPHRKGSTDQRCENALGRFTMTLQRDGMELYRAGEEYRSLHRQWRKMKGLPVEGSHTLGLGSDPDPEAIEIARRKVLSAQRAIWSAGEAAFHATNSLILDNADCPQDRIGPAWNGLWALASHFGMIVHTRAA